MKLLVLVATLALCHGQELPERRPVKRSYVCPPKFVRQGHRCYFFSKEPATWQDAHWHCRDMHSSIAIIKSANQDKLIRNFLSKKTLDPLERWLGGVYDWGKMAWKWASSGKPLVYNGFEKMETEDKEKLRWHCIIMDPSIQFRWSSRSCLEKKHYICHTKMKIVTNKGKKKLRRQYNVNKYNQLNEIPVPVIPDYYNDTYPLKSNVPISYKFEINNSLNDQALFAETPPVLKRKVKRNKKKKSKSGQPTKRKANATVTEVTNVNLNTTRKWKEKRKDKRMSMQNIKWKTYRKEAKQRNPLYPRPIVEEFNYVKEHTSV